MPARRGKSADTTETKGPGWRSGRRIIELRPVANKMECTYCKSTLSLHNIDRETRCGFGSTLYINCSCGTINSATTNKSHWSGNRGSEVFYINTKSATGSIKVD